MLFNSILLALLLEGDVSQLLLFAEFDFFRALLCFFGLVEIVALFLLFGFKFDSAFFRLGLSLEPFGYISVLFLDMTCALDHLIKMG